MTLRTISACFPSQYVCTQRSACFVLEADFRSYVFPIIVRALRWFVVSHTLCKFGKRPRCLFWLVEISRTISGHANRSLCEKKKIPVHWFVEGDFSEGPILGKLDSANINEQNPVRNGRFRLATCARQIKKSSHPW